MFTSTRKNKEISASKAIIEGISNDGGLYVINDIPKINNILSLKNKTYKELAFEVMKLFLDDYSNEEINECINNAYDSKFSSSNVVEIKKTNDSTYYLELFHGPTLAFKDVALTILPEFLKVAKIKNGIKEKTTILTATSGDTGSAALSGFSKVDGINIYVFYPNNGVSKIQEQQMLSFNSATSEAFALNGNFDYCQTFVKEIFAKHPKGLSSANSINIGRLIPQIVYYFYTYFYLLNNNEIKENELINFSVPTGNFGDILAGYYAYKMGLPINKLICSSNINKVLTDFFQTGVYDKRREFLKTYSPSMDILISSNLERLLYHSCSDPKKVSLYMDQLKQNGYYELDEEDRKIFDVFYANYSSDDEALETINEVFKSSSYLIDPHTAVAKSVYDKYKLETSDETKTVILSTASPYKFANAISKALNITETEEFSQIDRINQLTSTPIPSQIQNIRKNIKDKKVISIEEANNFLEENCYDKD